MTTPMKVHESKMLTEVRRWRREAYEADRTRTPQQRAEHLKELMKQFGLTRKPIAGNPPPYSDSK